MSTQRLAKCLRICTCLLMHLCACHTFCEYARNSQNKCWLISKENKLESEADHSSHPSQRHTQISQQPANSRILLKSSPYQQKHLTNPQLTPNVQAINAYCSKLMRFCSGLLLSIIMAIEYSYSCEGIQVYFFLLIQTDKKSERLSDGKYKNSFIF